MKFLTFTMSDVAKVAEVAQAADKVWASPPPGTKRLAGYVCQGIPFPGAPANTVVSVVISEAESNEAIAAVTWPMTVAGATVWSVPVLELPAVGVAGLEKKYRG